MSGLKDCVKSYAKKYGVSQAEAERQIKKALDIISDEIVYSGGVQFLGLFSIKTVTRKARIGRNPKTKIEYPIPETKTLKIKVGNLLKDAMNS